eukprot:gene9184-1272_t
MNKMKQKKQEKKNFLAVLKFTATISTSERNHVLKILDKYKDSFQDLPEKFRNDKEIALKAMERGYNLKHVSNRLKKDRDVVKKAVIWYGSCFEFADDTLKDDDEMIAYQVLSNFSEGLSYLDDELKNNPEIVTFAMSRGEYSFKHASDQLKKNKQFVSKVVSKNGMLLKFAEQSLKDNQEIVSIALKQNGKALEFASEKLRNHKNLVLIAVAQNDEEIIWAAAINDPSILKYIDFSDKNEDYFQQMNKQSKVAVKLSQNKKLFFKIVERNGMGLKYASENLKDDKDLVMIAVSKSCKSFKFASKGLMEDKELQWISQNRFCLIRDVNLSNVNFKFKRYRKQV